MFQQPRISLIERSYAGLSRGGVLWLQVADRVTREPKATVSFPETKLDSENGLPDSAVQLCHIPSLDGQEPLVTGFLGMSNALQEDRRPDGQSS
uniref:CHASE2 domain-containing protein n=1 Tax=Angiostrongylus cantonensis TaxID=6313 RepID=A0A0K0DB06_ANGCA